MEQFAKLQFVIFLLVVFFGTSLPFQSTVENVEDWGTSNIFRQIIFSILLVASLISIFYKRKYAIQIIKSNKYLFIFLLWSFITIAWSYDSMVSFKRFIVFFSTVTSSLSILLYCKRSEDLLKYFFYILGINMVLSLLSVLAIPGAKDSNGQWQGLYTDKNGFAQLCLISTVIFSAFFFKNSGLHNKLISVFLILIALVLIVGAGSSTIQVTLLLLFSISITLYINRIFEKLGLGKFVWFISIVTFSVVIVLIFYTVPELLGSSVGATGRDLTFTGRVYLWELLIYEIQNHFIFGAGFRGFWIIDAKHLWRIYANTSWLPTGGHNGYLDMLNELGIIGLTIFSSVIVNYFVKLKKLKQVWGYFFVATIIINFTESTFINPGGLTSVMFIFAYLALITDSYKLNNNNV